ncbi:MAG: hypothetical protein Q8940_14725 [Bacteroidota bacterium]|nr:hypothetical protein [Bacteroidota bacterium]
MKALVKQIIKNILHPVYRKYEALECQIEINRVLSAKLLINEIHKNDRTLEKLSDIEFKVFSQRGEDGIIQYLISKVPIENDTFVEFGVEDYKESNTRFLLLNNDWQGLVMDCSEKNVNKIKESDIYWKYNLTAISAFITKDNINELIEKSGIKGDIGLLSVDVDGNDYWIWDAISVVSPRIVVCEYNSLFGCKDAVTIPYDSTFYRTKAHYSNLYYGSSLKALCILAKKKGYAFVGCNAAGSNAFFVREDVSGNLRTLDCESGYVYSRARESRDRDGKLTFLSGNDRIKQISDMPVFDIITKENKKVSEIIN